MQKERNLLASHGLLQSYSCRWRIIIKNVDIPRPHRWPCIRFLSTSAEEPTLSARL